MANNLVTLKEYKDYVGITSTDQDTRIKAIMLYTSDLVKEYCGRKFIDYYNTTTSTYTDIVEYWRGGVDYYTPKEFPVQSVSKVEYSSDMGITYTELVAGVDFAFDLEKEHVYIPQALDYEGVNAFKITYTGGYSATPEALKLAVLDLIDYYMKQESVPKRVQQFVSVEFVKSATMPSHIKRVLDLYRVV